MNYLSLKIFKQGQLLKTKIFTDDQISIGSSEGLSLQLEGLSPWHVLIEQKHDVFCILDLNSEAGTLLNGQKITDETPIASGALINIGPYEIQFFIGPPVEQKAPKSPAEPKAQPTDVKPETQQPSAQPKSQKAPAGPETKAPLAEPKVQETAVKPEVEQAPPAQEASPEAVPSIFDEQEKAKVSQKPPQEKKKEVPFDKPPSVPDSLPEKGKKPVHRPVKPDQKGFWSTYAPSSKIQNLDEFLTPSIGNLIEVIVCWKERILSTHHFFKNGDVFMGSEKECQVKFPNMLGLASYKLMTIVSGAKIYLSHGIRGLLLQGKNQSTRTSHKLKGGQTVVLKPYEMVRLDFNDSLRVYVRLMDKPSPVPFAGLLKLKLSETLTLFLAFLLTGLLMFYGALYAPAFLAEDTEFIEKDIRVAKVVFKRPPRTQIVENDLSERTRKAGIKKKKPRIIRKRPAVKTIKKPIKRVKKQSTPRKGKQGKMAGQAPGKKRPKKPKVTVGSVRPGGSLKTGKKGSSAKTVASDPSKVGLLGAFGGGGKLSQLDKGASGSGGLLGLAEKSTGFAGTAESYEGEGIGTKTKDLGTGGKGSALVGISGIKTKGKGLGMAGSGTGGLGKRGRMNIEFSTEDIDLAGEIDRVAILQALKRNQSKFQRCYQTSLNTKPSLQGNLGMQWLISSSGRGRQARALNDQIGSSILVSCVAGVLERLNFPEPPSGQTPKVTFTFRFYL